MRIGQISSKTGVSRDTVRLYEKLGLLTNVTRPYEYNNYKDYGEENVYRIGMIKEMQRIGLKLRECKGIIDALVNDEMNIDDRKKFIQSRIKQTNEQIKSLQQIRRFLQEHLDKECAYNSTPMIAKLRGKKNAAGQ
jgi:DNA-binding transcriptional MerR regulator